MKQYISMKLIEDLQRVVDHGLVEKDGTHLISAEYLIEAINKYYIITEQEDKENET